MPLPYTTGRSISDYKAENDLLKEWYEGLPDGDRRIVDRIRGGLVKMVYQIGEAGSLEVAAKIIRFVKEREVK